MSKPFSFIPLLKTQLHKINNANLRGVINLRIEVLNAIHISKDSYDINDSNVIYKEFYKIGDNYAIPGTSIKGMIRSVAEMVSYSCISKTRDTERNIPTYKNKPCIAGRYIKNTYEPNDICIICDIFGAMGKKSKIKISNFIHDKATGKADILGLPELKEPHANVAHIYLNENGKFNGYKIYNHGIQSILKTGNYKCECLKDGAIFKGHIIYENLDEEELQLLCYSLGLANDFNHKIGYGKPAYYGSIKVSTDNYEYVKKANEYINNAQKDIKQNIGLLEKNYSYKNAKKHPDYEEASY